MTTTADQPRRWPHWFALTRAYLQVLETTHNAYHSPEVEVRNCTFCRATTRAMLAFEPHDLVTFLEREEDAPEHEARNRLHFLEAAVKLLVDRPDLEPALVRSVLHHIVARDAPDHYIIATIRKEPERPDTTDFDNEVIRLMEENEG